MEIHRRHVLTILLASSACTRKPAPVEMLPDFGRLPAFQLIDQSGRSFSRADFAGKVWIVDFIFTRCGSACPRLTAQMRKLQDRVTFFPEARLLSISIDPEHDTSQILSTYAARYKTDPARWSFLTGDKATIRAMQVKTERHMDPEDIIVHSKHFYLVDGNGYIRGEYPVNDPAASEDILVDLKRLIANPAKPEPGVS
jgi:protein SCO1/2